MQDVNSQQCVDILNPKFTTLLVITDVFPHKIQRERAEVCAYQIPLDEDRSSVSATYFVACLTTFSLSRLHLVGRRDNRTFAKDPEESS
jgi:hypothetical protein